MIKLRSVFGKETGMFICKGCMKDDQHYDFHMFKSHGPCEICGKTQTCADCHCPPPAKEKNKKK